MKRMEGVGALVRGLQQFAVATPEVEMQLLDPPRTFIKLVPRYGCEATSSRLTSVRDLKAQGIPASEAQRNWLGEPGTTAERLRGGPARPLLQCMRDRREQAPGLERAAVTGRS